MPKVKKIQHSKVHSDGDKIKVSFTQSRNSTMNCSRSSSNLSWASSSSLLATQESALALQQQQPVSKLKHSQSTKVVSHPQNNIKSTLNHTSSEVGISRTRSGSIAVANNMTATTSSSLTGGSGSSPETTLDLKHNKSDTTGLDKKLKRKSSKRSISKRSNRNFHQLFPSVSTDETVIDSKSFLQSDISPTFLVK